VFFHSRSEYGSGYSRVPGKQLREYGSGYSRVPAVGANQSLVIQCKSINAYYYSTRINRKWQNRVPDRQIVFWTQVDAYIHTCTAVPVPILYSWLLPWFRGDHARGAVVGHSVLRIIGGPGCLRSRLLPRSMANTASLPSTTSAHHLGKHEAKLATLEIIAANHRPARCIKDITAK
jgi:hypothetical protein